MKSVPRPLHILLRSIQALAWLIFLGALALLIIEESGYLTSTLRNVVAWRMGPLGEGLSIESVNVRWFEPGLELHGVRLRDPRKDSTDEILYLRQIHFTFEPDIEARALARLHVNGGRVTISESLFNYIDELTESINGEGDGSLPGASLRRPPLLLTQLELALELPGEQVIDLGQISLGAQPTAEKRYALSGQLTPRLGGAVVGETSILVRGELGAQRLDIEAFGKNLNLRTAGVRVPPALGSMPVEDFSGLFSLEAAGQILFGPRFEVSGNLRASIDDARLQPRKGDPWVEDLRLRLDLASSFVPEQNPDLWDRETWKGSAHAQANWNESPVDLWAQLGSEVPEGHWARVLGRVPALPLKDESMAALGLRDQGLGLRHALVPRGLADISLEFLLDRDLSSPSAGLVLHRFATLAEFHGEAGMTFEGFVDPESRQRFGVPIPVEEVRGAAWITLIPTDPLPLRIALPQLPGQLTSRKLHAQPGLSTGPAPHNQGTHHKPQ